MELSRSAQKRQREQLEKLAAALVALPAGSLPHIPCSEEIRDEIRAASAMQAGARKRHIKYVVKLLEAAGDTETLYRFIAKAQGAKKGGGLAEERIRQRLEHCQNALIDEALAEAAREAGGAWNGAREQWDSPTLAAIRQELPQVDAKALLRLAGNFAATRNPRHIREIFRLLKAAWEMRERSTPTGGGSEPE